MAIQIKNPITIIGSSASGNNANGLPIEVDSLSSSLLVDENEGKIYKVNNKLYVITKNLPSNLTGCEMSLKEGYSAPAGYGEFNILGLYQDFDDPEYWNEFTKLSIGYDNNGVKEGYICFDNETSFNHTTAIYIEDGTDVANNDLIQWFATNIDDCVDSNGETPLAFKEILTPVGELDIITNGTVNVTEYAIVNVNVANSGGGGNGLDTSDATATSSDILLGKTAYVNGEKVTGNIETFNGEHEGGVQVKDMLQARVDATNSCRYLFYAYTGDNVDFIANLDTSKVTDASGMFKNCYYLTSTPQLDTSNVTNMNEMFYGCSKITTIHQLDTSKVTNMGYMFSGCQKLTSIPELDTSKVTIIERLFHNCFSLTSIPQLDTSNVTNTCAMFYECKLITSIPLLDTSKVTNMESMFYGCINLIIVPQINVSNVTSMGYIFQSCSKLKSLLMYGMKVSFNISPSTQFEVSDLVTILSNCQVITSSQKLTMGSTNLAKLDGVYVKETGVEPYNGITVRPCVICESTDEGAMLATDYFTAKGWTLA